MDRKMAQEVIERRTVRQNLVKNADRSEKIRTYNFAQVRVYDESRWTYGTDENLNALQDRVTDHRIGLSLMNMTSVMEGEGLLDILQALQERYRHDQLEDILVE